MISNITHSDIGVVLADNRGSFDRACAARAEPHPYLLTFVTDYNQTRLRCLGYRAPAQLRQSHGNQGITASRRHAATAIAPDCHTCMIP